MGPKMDPPMGFFQATQVGLGNFGEGESRGAPDTGLEIVRRAADGCIQSLTIDIS